MSIPDPIAKAAKAVLAATVAALGGLALVVTGNEGFADVTVAEWLIVASTTAGAFAGVYGIRNRASS